MTTRRDFIKKTVAGTAALSLGSILPGFGSSRYQDILGANEKIRIGVVLRQIWWYFFYCE